MNNLKLITIIVLLLTSPQVIACGLCGPSYGLGSEDRDMFFPTDYNHAPYCLYVSHNNNDCSTNFIKGHIPFLPLMSDMESFLITYRYLEGKSNVNVDEFKVLEEQIESYSKKWLELNNEIDQNEPYYPCTEDAARFAVEQFELKEKKYNNENFKTWLDNQNLVFKNCHSQELTLPLLPNQDDIDLNKDYDYQTAASYFYKSDYDKAIDAFTKISKDEQSPYQDISNYLIFRTLFHKKRDEGGNSNDFINKFNAEKTLIEKSQYAKDIYALNNYFTSRDEPRKRIYQLLDKLINEEFVENDLDELRYLKNIRHEYFRADIESSVDHPFIIWMSVWGNGRITFSQTVNLWQQHKTLPWLMLVCEKITREDLPVKDEIINALKQITVGQPGYTMAQQYLAKLALISGDYLTSKQITEDMLNNKDLVLYEQNLFKYLHSFTAKSYETFLNDILTTKVIDNSQYYNDPENVAYIKDFDNLSFNNIQQVPVELLIKASNYDLPLYLKQRFIAASFARYVVLDDMLKVDELIPKLIELIPELQEDFQLLGNMKDKQKSLFGFLSKKNKQKALLAHLIIMRYPSLNIYVNNYQWRRGMKNQTYTSGIANFGNNWFGGVSYNKAPFSTNFLNKEQKQQAQAELKDIEKNLKGGAVDYFCNKAIDAYKIKSDLAPEMLHRCVHMSRYSRLPVSLYDDNYSRAVVPSSSKKAFDILHKNFKNNIFTKKTPYHYYVANKVNGEQ